MLHTGLYEQVINKKIRDELAAAADKLQQTAPLDEAEASGILAKYVAEIIEKGLDDLKDSGGNLYDQVALTNKIVSLIHIDFIDEPVEFGFDCPLDLYCSYTRDQILLALGYMKPGTVREGVKWLPERQSDVFFVTLNKSDKEYSPTTMYDDYSINEWMFHWQSQSTTSEDSLTGQRYIHHKERKSSIFIFVREFRTDVAGTAPYTFLGLADYMKHEGSRPMSIAWKLKRPIPAKYLKKTNKLVVG